MTLGDGAAHTRSSWTSLVFADEHDGAVLNRAVRRGTLRRMVRGVYTCLPDCSIDDFMDAFWLQIVNHFFPHTVITGESALWIRRDSGDADVAKRSETWSTLIDNLKELGICRLPDNGIVTVVDAQKTVGSRQSVHRFGPMTVSVIPGAEWQSDDEPAEGTTLYLASSWRAVLEWMRCNPREDVRKLLSAYWHLFAQKGVGVGAPRDGNMNDTAAHGFLVQGSVGVIDDGYILQLAERVGSSAGSSLVKVLRDMADTGAIGDAAADTEHDFDGNKANSPVQRDWNSSGVGAIVADIDVGSAGGVSAGDRSDHVRLGNFTVSALDVGATLLRDGEATRPELADSTGLSRPTVGQAVKELGQRGLIHCRRQTSQHPGRSPLIYAISDSAGWTLGLDIGNAQMQLLARSLNGQEIDHRTFIIQNNLTNSGSYSAEFEHTLDTMARHTKNMLESYARYGSLRTVTFGMSKPIHANHTIAGREGPSLAAMSADAIVDYFDFPANTTILLENNVNCALLVEAANGVAQTVQDAVYLQIGRRLGSGIFTDGHIIHGAHGGAGEIADIPFPWTKDANPSDMGIEHFLGQVLYADGQVMDNSAVTRQIVLIIRAFEAIIDPQMVILGGALGSDRKFFSAVRRQCEQSGVNVQLKRAAFGDSGTVRGASLLAHYDAAMAMFGPRSVSKRLSLLLS